MGFRSDEEEDTNSGSKWKVGGASPENEVCEEFGRVVEGNLVKSLIDGRLRRGTESSFNFTFFCALFVVLSERERERD